jgi:hypothetical protein
VAKMRITNLYLFLLFTLPFFLKDNIKILVFFTLIGTLFFITILVGKKKGYLHYKLNSEYFFFFICVSISVFWGLIGILFSPDLIELKDIIRDILYLYSGVIILFTVVNFTNINQRNIKASEFLNVLYISIFFLTTLYLGEIFNNLNYNFGGFLNSNDLFWAKREAGELPYLTSIGVGFLLLQTHKKKLVHKFIIIYGLIGSIMFLSRTSLLIITLALLIGIILKKERIKKFHTTVLIFGIFVISLLYFGYNIQSYNENNNVFLNKIENSLTEIRFWGHSEFSSFEDIQQNWRSYESEMALNNIKKPYEYLIGKGLGNLVPLYLYIKLNDEIFSKIPIIHNGIIYIIYKCGFLGLIFYLLGFITLFKTNNNIDSKQRKLLLFLCLVFIFNSLTITSFFNPGFSYSLWILLVFVKNNFFNCNKGVNNEC